MFHLHLVFGLSPCGMGVAMVMIVWWLIYNYLCNQCLSPLKLWVWIQFMPIMARCIRFNCTNPLIIHKKIKLVLLSCNNVAPVTNLCLGRATTRSHSWDEWQKLKMFREKIFILWELHSTDICSQASYRYVILWEAFLDPSDSYFLFAEERGYHKWALAHSSSCYI
jgi:hypothetical protein